MNPLPVYDKFPALDVAGGAGMAWAGWPGVTEQLARTITERAARMVCIECYPGVALAEIVRHMEQAWPVAEIIDTRQLMLSREAIDTLVQRDVTDDPVFGRLTGLKLADFFDHARLRKKQAEIAEGSSPVIIIGPGASLVHAGDLLIYADLARWEAQLRFRRNESANLGSDNYHELAALQYKRAFFVDWRVADRHKKRVLPRADFLLDTNLAEEPRLVTGPALREALRQTAHQPFRVVPFFDPAPWGGEWMRQRFKLDSAPPNFGWGFDCVPEENSLHLLFGAVRVEIPAINVVFFQPNALLGDAVHARFGTEFPIRTDFLDTMGGGNLSLQVHPTTEYIQQEFGMHYTQDESYYILDAAPYASVYLGLKTGCDEAAMLLDLKAANEGQAPFNAETYANRCPARKHDHFLIPAGTVHCSGANTMVLEISATPYIFTLKLWDWERLGLDGRPRPIHLEHGAQVIDFSRNTEWVRNELINRLEPIGAGEGWREERTGLHAREFIETRRFWFTRQTMHNTLGNLNVLNLVEGEAVVLESPQQHFPAFVLNYAETVIIPAAVGAYTIRPLVEPLQREYGLLKIYVRTGLPGGI